MDIPASDAIVIGSGPNGMAAAITLAQAGLKVTVLEAQQTIGGGASSTELTLPGFVHDVCSAVHPLAISSPFFRTLPLNEHGLEWIQPPLPLAHPLDDATAVAVYRSLDETANKLGRDGNAYRDLVASLVESWDELLTDILAPIHLPKNLFGLARFGLNALRSAHGLAHSKFSGERARALFAGLAAHSMLPLEKAGSAAFGLILGASVHAVGWPFPRGGAQKITDALASYFRSLGGSIVTGFRVESLDQLPKTRAVLCDVTPRQLLAIAGNRFSEPYHRVLKNYRYGPGAFKVDWALREPIPWRAEECRHAGTVHLGGTLEEIAASERAPWRNQCPGHPFVLLAQPTLFDNSRAPAGKHIAWAYCHIPNGSTVDMLARIESQIERFAPGFRDVILARSVMGPAALQSHNANLVGGDINGGAQDLWQIFLRPSARLYRTPAQGVYICSSSTPPGGGVHGMCGHFAAAAVIKDLKL